MKPTTKILFCTIFIFWIYYSCAEPEKDGPSPENEDTSSFDGSSMSNGHGHSNHGSNHGHDNGTTPEDTRDPYVIANEFYLAADYDNALIWYQKSADLGNPSGQYSLANLYYSGYGTLQDYDKAFEWYTKSADQGNHLAKYMIGKMYSNGHGVTLDHAEALKWYTQGADENNPLSQYAIGKIYYYGDGVTQNYDEALKWYIKAATQGNGNAIKMVGHIHFKGLGSQSIDKDLAFSNYLSDETPYLLEDKDVGGQITYNTAVCYLEGNCDSNIKNKPKGIEMLEISADTYSNVTAMFYLGIIYEQGFHDQTKDTDLAISWYQKCVPSKQECQDRLNILQTP